MAQDDCIFCKIARKEIPVEMVYEDREVIVFLDAFPAVKGQTLVIPKKHIAPYLFDADDGIYTKLMLTAKKIAKAIDNAMKPIKTGMVVEGLELAHVHIKLYPLSMEGFRCLRKPIPKLSKQEMKEISTKIKNSL